MPIGAQDLKGHFAAGGKAVNGWCSIPSPVTAEIMARQGYDTITIDLQHGLIDYQTALSMLQVISGFGMPTLCRVPWNEPGIIMKLLDAGSGGIICPMINTREEAERFAGACRYAPMGYRSFGPTRALQLYGAEYGTKANKMITAIAMIETAEAMQNLDSILEVGGIDGVYIGPSDLAISLGYAPTLLPSEPAVVKAIETIRKRTKDSGKLAGIHCGSPEHTAKMLDGGFDFGSLMNDARMLTTILSANLAAARKTEAGPAKAQY